MRRFFIVLLLAQSVFAQKKGSTAIDLLPHYSYHKGLGITTPDSLFQIQTRFRLQNKSEVRFAENEATQYNSEIRRLRLRFDGFVVSPKFGYTIQLSFSPGDVGGSSVNIIRDAMFFYQPIKGLTLGFGQTKLAGNRQRINSSGALQFTDRSITNAEFNIDRDFGFHLAYAHQFLKIPYTLKASLTSGEGRNSTEKNTGVAYTGRLEVFPLGRFKKNGELFEGDVLREETPKLYVATSYHFNEKATKTQGQRGEKLLENVNLTSVFVDTAFKYNGWAFLASYMQRHTPKAILQENEKVQYIYKGYGIDSQISYNFLNNWELVGRYSFVNPASEVKNALPKQNQFSLGINKYIWEHALKVQFEISKNQQKLGNDIKADWVGRFQIEIGI